MERYGDLSGVIFNRHTNQVVGGHQRLKVIPPDATITIVEELEEPTPQGTVAHGYIAVGAELWTYREVEWSEEDELAANLAANKHGGEFAFPQLTEILSELDSQGFPDMGLTGFTEAELENILTWTPNPGGGVDPAEEWAGMPEFEHEDQRAHRSIRVHFPNDKAVEEFQQLIGQAFSDKAKYIWHPKLERSDFTQEEWRGQSGEAP